MECPCPAHIKQSRGSFSHLVSSLSSTAFAHSSFFPCLFLFSLSLLSFFHSLILSFECSSERKGWISLVSNKRDESLKFETRKKSDWLAGIDLIRQVSISELLTRESLEKTWSFLLSLFRLSCDHKEEKSKKPMRKGGPPHVRYTAEHIIPYWKTIFNTPTLRFLTHSENLGKGTWRTRLFESRDRRALSIY